MQCSRILFGSLALLALTCRSDPPEGDPIAFATATRPPRLITPDAPALAHFASEVELRAYLARVEELEAIEWANLERRWQSEALRSSSTSAVAFDSLAAYTPNLEVSDVGTITNNQERGVDEGDIVKRIGKFLVVLRRGRLYSIEIGRRPGDPFRLADVADVFPYSVPHEGWYDEVLVGGDRIVVLGYSYETEATELSIFELDRRGRIRHRASHAIRSGDYYSWENYGSRLVDHRLVIYAPIDLSDLADDGSSPWPVYSTWGRTGLSASWEPLVDEIEIVEPLQAGLPTMLHTVIECELDDGELDCEARGVIGNGSSVHHVSATAVHLWIDGPLAPFDPMSTEPAEYEQRLRLEPDSLGGTRSSPEDDGGMVYRIPFDGSAIGVVAVVGSPSDQFSFREADGALDLFLVRWNDQPEESGDASWWHVPLASFDRPLGESTGIDVHRLPGLDGDWECRGAQRFVADRLLYGDCREGANGRKRRGVHVIELVSRPTSRFVETPGRVDRIEPIADDALVVGEAGSDAGERAGTHLLPILLSGAAHPGTALFLEGRIELENRSHAFNWTPDDEGVLMGLPFARLEPITSTAVTTGSILGASEPTSLIEYFTMDDAGMLTGAGELAERRRVDPPPDDCETSCYDWYGSVRPIFVDDRVLGLIADELVEARRGSMGIREIQRMRMRRGR